MRHILIVDDDREIVQLIAIYLQNESFRVSKAYNGEEALAIVDREKIDLMILDVMMPKLDGLEVCRRIRARNHVPILMISAKAEDIDKITGLMSGADDYLTKPFNPLELVARVKTLIRRAYLYQEEQPEEEVIRLGSLEVNKTFHRVTVNGKTIPLTAKEFDILFLMASHLGRVFSSEEIFEQVWKERYFQANNTVMVHISNLREKLEKELGYKLIKTIWGVGYKIDG